MGLTVGTETVTLEKRLKNIHIEKDLETNTAVIKVDWALGYFDVGGSWHTTKEGTETLTMDAVNFLMGLSPDTVGITSSPVTLGEFLLTVAYGVISGQIQTYADVLITVTDSVGNPVTTGLVDIYDVNGELIASGKVGERFRSPIVVNAVVEVAIPNHGIEVIEFPILQGNVEYGITLQ